MLAASALGAFVLFTHNSNAYSTYSERSVCLLVALCIVAKWCKIGLWYVSKSNTNV